MADHARTGEQGFEPALLFRVRRKGARLVYGELFEHLAHAPCLVGKQPPAERGVFQFNRVPPVFCEQFVQAEQQARGVHAFGGELCGQIQKRRLSLARAYVHQLFYRLAHARFFAPLPVFALGADRAEQRFFHRFERAVFRFRRAVERGERVLYLPENRRYVEQSFARKRALGVDRKAGELFFAVRFELLRPFAEQLFGQEREYETWHERSEQGKIKPACGNAPQIMQHIAQNDVRQKHCKGGGQFPRAKKGKPRARIGGKHRYGREHRFARGCAACDRFRQR